MTLHLPPDTIAAIADAALASAAQRGWSAITLPDVLDQAGVSAASVYGAVRDKRDLIGVAAARFDQEAAAEMDLDAEASARERAFDVAMARFDAMERRRLGAASMLQAVRRDPSLWLPSAAWMQRSSRWLLMLARFDTAGLAGVVRVKGFAAILVRATQAWMKDDGGDLSRTMAQLDRDLRDIEDRGGRWPFARKPSSSTAQPDSAGGDVADTSGDAAGV